MASKRDQLQAHQFQVERVISALVLQETDPEYPPFRRPRTAAIAGIVIGILSLVGVGVFGFIVPGGNKSWQDGNSVIVEKETGSRFVYLEGQLHPTTNYASAILALGKHPEVLTVSHNSLVGVPRGAEIGIPDAPDSMPGPDNVPTAGWTLCSEPTINPIGATIASSALLVGESPIGGQLAGERAVLVQNSGTKYVIYHGYKHSLLSPDVVTVGLALGSVQAITVNPALLDSLPLGDPIGPIALVSVGKKSTAVPGRADIRSGQLLVMQTPGGATQHFLAQPDQLLPISELSFDIQLALPQTAAAYSGEPFPMVLSPSSVTGAKVAAAPQGTDTSPPVNRPVFAPAGTDMTTLCLAFDSGSFVPRVIVAPGLPPVASQNATAGRTAGGVALADYVIVPPGKLAIAQVMSSPTDPAGAMALVTDMGVAYPVANADVLGWLGYSAVPPIRVPAGLMARMPQGPGLSHDAAMQRA
jgi:type VII secretion protein EccB